MSNCHFRGVVLTLEFNQKEYRVEYLNGGFLLRREYQNIINLEPTDFNYGSEVEVIGNIYETKEK